METITRSVRTGGPAASVLAAAIVEGSTQPMVASDSSGRLLLANAAAREIWNLEPTLARRRGAREIEWSLTAQARSVDPLGAALRGTGVQGLRCQLRLADGQSREATVETRVLSAPDGRTVGALMTVTLGAASSITARRLPEGSSDLELLFEVRRILAEVCDPAEAAAMIAQVALEATGARRIAPRRSERPWASSASAAVAA